MPVKGNYCDAEVRFICKTHNQPICIYFKQDEDIPSLVCKYGLPDRKCRNENANQLSLNYYQVVRKWEDN